MPHLEVPAPTNATQYCTDCSANLINIIVTRGCSMRFSGMRSARHSTNGIRNVATPDTTPTNNPSFNPKSIAQLVDVQPARSHIPQSHIRMFGLSPQGINAASRTRREIVRVGSRQRWTDDLIVDIQSACPGVMLNAPRNVIRISFRTRMRTRM